MTIKIRSEETSNDSKFFYHNQDVTSNYQIDMIENGINIWIKCDEMIKNKILLPFKFDTFQITNDEDIITFRKYIKKISIGNYVAILITGNLPYKNEKLVKTFEMIGGSRQSILSLSESNANLCLIGYRGQLANNAKQEVGDCSDTADGGISVWVHDNKNRCKFKSKLLINIRNKTPLYKNISSFYKKHVKGEKHRL